MSFLKSIFNAKEKPIDSYSDFWNWFEQNEKKFHKVLKEQGNINKVFFDKLAPKLNELKDGFWFLAGMYDDNTAELILTADGIIKNIVFVEELVQSAPKMNNWKITALKQPSDINQYGIEMDGYKFDESKMDFYSTDHNQMPDEIDITITHKDFSEENRAVMTNGVYLALDNSLGELNSVTTIDNVNIINSKDATSDLIPLEKLKDFLTWREKEFVEKYKGFRHNTENDNYSGLEATLKNGLPLVAVINTDLLNWDSKASHPWIAVMEIKYDGKNNNGMPDDSTYQLLNEIEDKIMTELKDSDGYLNIGRQTADSVREIYFACVEFRNPSKILHEIKKEYINKIELDFDIYKDKYWQSFNRFSPN
ncbi:DUF695 domain-containing protein [Patiriisocius hiemis]|uniref:DUF695 domain-containing protein n=1 Tax=Patiriisocius hiemis TaxID=3075604 RepID=A0ABU2Y9Y3_9FLAO|nr:DUF695 domain-containing protein [Constantimarinum sp. W242]MDT0554651.1 DUF695 domain-containing protein [Constantimarinum sp. W242]